MKRICIYLFLFTWHLLAEADTLPWLHAHDTQIVDETGRPVILRGVNLGGWLVEEMWMMPFQTEAPKVSPFADIQDHVSLWKTLEARFGKEKALNLRHSLRTAWLSEKDFQNIKEAGCKHLLAQELVFGKAKAPAIQR